MLRLHHLTACRNLYPKVKQPHSPVSCIFRHVLYHPPDCVLFHNLTNHHKHQSSHLTATLLKVYSDCDTTARTLYPLFGWIAFAPIFTTIRIQTRQNLIGLALVGCRQRWKRRWWGIWYEWLCWKRNKMMIDDENVDDCCCCCSCWCCCCCYYCCCWCGVVAVYVAVDIAVVLLLMMVMVMQW